MAMDFAQQQRDPTRHLIGIGAVVILHVLVVWALVSGLARKVVEVVKGPIEVKVIEEIIKKPPPPPEVIPPPPNFSMIASRSFRSIRSSPIASTSSIARAASATLRSISPVPFTSA